MFNKLCLYRIKKETKVQVIKKIKCESIRNFNELTYVLK